MWFYAAQEKMNMSRFFVGKMFRILTFKHLWVVHVCLLHYILSLNFPENHLIQPAGDILLVWKAKLPWDWEDKLGKRAGNTAGRTLASCVTAVLSSNLRTEPRSGKTPVSGILPGS